jgi:phytoene dehydrogenase-like protein
MATAYDLIVVGSGMGGLTVASLMALLRGKRVLVLERHFKAGGFTHTFRRGRFHWDVGLHYVGGMAPGTPSRKLFDLVTDGAVHWSPMPDVYDRFCYPGLRFDVPTGSGRLVSALCERFPEERVAIRRYMRDVRRAALGIQMEMMRSNGSAVARSMGWLVGRLLRSDMQRTTKEYLDAHIRDEQLAAVLASQWGDYGLPPGLSPFPLHALIATHYADGAWYPEGGAGTIADGVRTVVEREGGAIRLSSEVVEVIVRADQAVGVRLRDGEEILAPLVVSDAGAAITYLKLVSGEQTIPFRDDLRRFVEGTPTTTSLSLYLGLRRDPRELGFQGENYWIFSGFDHDRMYAERGDWIADGQPRIAYLSFPSLKDPRAQSHTAEIITFTSFEPFARWQDKRWLRRGDDYLALKERLSDALIRFVDRECRGFAGLVEYRELSTPLTNEFMTGHWKGGIYGLPSVGDRYRAENRAWTHPRSPIRGLYLTGADTGSLGIAGAVMGGVTTLSCLPGGVSTIAAYRAAQRHEAPSAASL